MAVLEQVNQLRSQGMNDDQIAENLQQQGASPKEITDAINQANIKSAVSGGNPGNNPGNPGAQPNPGEAPPNPNAAGAGAYTPSTQEMGGAGGNYDAGGAAAGAYDAGAGGYAGGEDAYAAQGYDTGAGAGYGGGYVGGDSGTMVEIANQVFTDKSKKIQDQLDDLNEFKSITKTKVDSIDERLKKIEKMIDTLQIKILEKVGNYGRELDSTKKEVAMVEDTVGKLTKNMAEKKSSKSSKSSGNKSKSSSKKSSSKKSKKK